MRCGQLTSTAPTHRPVAASCHAEGSIFEAGSVLSLAGRLYGFWLAKSVLNRTGILLSGSADTGREH
jgi:hypothetical protein